MYGAGGEAGKNGSIELLPVSADCDRHRPKIIEAAVREGAHVVHQAGWR